MDKGRLQPDIVKHEVEPLLLQEAVRRGSSSPEDKLLSPPLAPSPPPPPPPKRRGRPPGSAKSQTAAAAASSTAALQTLERDGAARPSLKRQRNSEKEEAGNIIFPAPISAPPPLARHNLSASSAGGKAREKLVFFGGVDQEESLSSSDCSSVSHDDDRSLSWMRTRGKSGQFLGVGDCEVFFRVRIGGEKMSTWCGDAAFAGMPRIAIITTKTRDRVVQVTDCLRRGHPLPPPVTAFCTRGAGGTAAACNVRNRVGHGAGKVSASLLRKMLGMQPDEAGLAAACHSREGDHETDKCAYELCPYPAHSSGNWKIVQPSTCAGGRDWSMFVGKMFCHACWTQYRTKGTLERLGRKDKVTEKSG